MTTHEKQRERGFTLIELIASIGASAIVMLTVMNLMGMTHRNWAKGLDKIELTRETAIAVERITEEVRSADKDSVTVSANGDTLKLGVGERIYTNNSYSLIFQGPNGSFTYLKGMVTGFTITKPVILAPGDTLKGAVKLTLALQNDEAYEATSVLIFPRVK